MKLHSILFGLLLVLPFTAPVHAMDIGDQLHSIEGLKHLKGSIQDKLEMREHKGKLVLINFWATWCGPCKKEYPELIKIANKHSASTYVLSISVDNGFESINEFVFQGLNPDHAVSASNPNIYNATPFDMALLTPNILGENLEDIFSLTWGIPATYLFDREGRFIAIEVGGLGSLDKIISNYENGQSLSPNELEAQQRKLKSYRGH